MTTNSNQLPTHPTPFLSELSAADQKFLQRVVAALPITADVSRADILLCLRQGTPRGQEELAQVLHHAMPYSTPSLYRESTVGRAYTIKEQPLIWRALTNGSRGRQRHNVLRNGVPVIQDVYPVYGPSQQIIASLVVETNLIAHERQRRRDLIFRRAVIWLQEMCARGELVNTESLSRFEQYDGIYLVNRKRYVLYMSGIASNLFRTIGLLIDVRGEDVSLLEAADRELVEQTFAQQQSLEVRHEMADGRVWTRKTLPLRLPPLHWLPRWISRGWPWAYRYVPADETADGADVVLVLIHNATEAVQKERELNVKAAMIQEVHHRVKNNLQNIAAILRIQARRAKGEETKQFLADAVNRVLSMSVIHEFLSQDSHRPINLRDVCSRIASQVVEVANTPDKEVKFEVSGPNVRLPASQATPAALVINELILNAVEHGLAERRSGLIDIRLHDLGDRVQLDITDDGGGLPANFHPEQSSSLGLQIVRTLVTDDLKGALHIVSLAAGGEEATVPPKHGTRATVIFPKRSLAVD